jgi:hypothetical protein
MSRLNLLAFTLLLPSFSMLAAAQSDSAAPTTTIYTSSDIVVVDVTVTDGQQNPVHHLTAGDFKILEDGHLQTVKNFEEHSTPTTPPPITPIPKLEPGTYTNFTPAPASGPLTILLLDTLNTEKEDQIYVRNQLLKYLKEAKPGTEIAIFRLGTSLQLIKGFTTDIDEVTHCYGEGKAQYLSAAGQWRISNGVRGGRRDAYGRVFNSQIVSASATRWTTLTCWDAT